ncbi:MAG TPA: SDR family NAD(P)-dependent oxidoreductase [Acidimicrobiales bacterium]|nr:SDR family NAD(P)-dependent oxidoreductase [Acidimicrobiales bacterium]
MDVRGRRVLITGASRGIGESLARRFAAEGATVALVARNAGAIEKVAADLGGTAHPADLADAEQVSTLVSRVESESGPVDVLVNNAGIAPTIGAFQDWSREDVEETYRVNVVTPAELCRQVIPGMLRRGEGHIVNVSSLAGCAVYPGLTIYSSTKAGLSQLTAGLRADLKGLPVSTTLVELGPIPTDMLGSVDEYKPVADSFRRFYRLQLLKDVSRETVADTVVEAVVKRRRHVRHPKRAVLFPMLTEAPRRMAELLLTGIKPRVD